MKVFRRIQQFNDIERRYDYEGIQYKNLIEILPIYMIMEKRNNEIFEKKCQRCRRDDENWVHIWNCDRNERSIYEIINNAMDEQIREIKGNTIKVTEERWKERIMSILTKDFQ
ncbi:hypothetical protein C1645_833956 [Glomus cerebriforme]|uniref:Uncharacterized protein n=1 Tax=Glomus cerebriforme TaxID=658196 RepID=A0A397SLA1_9GLOM|nr:hypothetical protein C1645_833956 [Glomus cerebriforme]